MPARHLPALTAVDEGSVEPSPAALPSFLRALPHRSRYRSRSTRTGRVADGYEVQDEPWLVLTSPRGRIALVLGRLDHTAGRRRTQLRSHVRCGARSRANARCSPAAAAADSGLADAAGGLHAQASQLLGVERRSPRGSGRCAAIRSSSTSGRRGASRAGPSSALFANASARYGRAGRIHRRRHRATSPATRSRSWPPTTSAIRATSSRATSSRRCCRAACRVYRRRSTSTAPARSSTSTPVTTRLRAPSTPTSTPTGSVVSPRRPSSRAARAARSRPTPRNAILFERG